jgi:hypothetical protein
MTPPCRGQVDDNIGRAIELQIREGGVSTKDIVWFNTKVGPRPPPRRLIFNQQTVC